MKRKAFIKRLATRFHYDSSRLGMKHRDDILNLSGSPDLSPRIYQDTGTGERYKNGFSSFGLEPLINFGERLSLR